MARAGYGLFYGAFENRGGNPSLGYNYPFQFTLQYLVAERRVAEPAGRWIARRPDARDRIVLDPVNVNANGLQVRGVEFDYKTPRYHNYNVTLQTEIIPSHSIEVGYVGTRGRNLETFTGMNNVTRLLPPGTNPQQHVTWPNIARGSILVRTVGVSDYDSLQMKFQRRYHAGLGFLVSYTLSDSNDQCGRLALRRRRRRPAGAGRGRLESRERHREVRLLHQARAGLQRHLRSAREGARSSAAGAPTGSRRSTAARRRRSTAPLPPAPGPAVMRSSSAIRMRAATT